MMSVVSLSVLLLAAAVLLWSRYRSRVAPLAPRSLEELLAPGEQIHTWGSGVRQRPPWQNALTAQFRLCRVLWPTVMYQMVTTTYGRVLVAKTSARGTLRDPRAYRLEALGVAHAQEEILGLAMRLNPLARSYRTFAMTLELPDGGALPLYCVPGTFLNALRA